MLEDDKRKAEPLEIALEPNHPKWSREVCQFPESNEEMVSKWQQLPRPQPEKDLKSPSSTRLEALVPFRDSRARTLLFYQVRLSQMSSGLALPFFAGLCSLGGLPSPPATFLCFVSFITSSV